MKRVKKTVVGVFVLGLCLFGACGEKTGYPLPTKVLKPTQPLNVGEVPDGQPGGLLSGGTDELLEGLGQDGIEQPGGLAPDGSAGQPGGLLSGGADGGLEGLGQPGGLLSGGTDGLSGSLMSGGEDGSVEQVSVEGLNLQLVGDATVEVDRLSVWQDPGARAFDGEEGELSDRVCISGTVDTEKCGCYVLRYTVENSAGDKETKERMVLVRWNKEDVEQAEAAGKVVYLTFDDGPSEHTDRLLDILKKYDVQATFFLCGTSRLRKQLVAGHAIGAHSATHDYSIYVTDEAYFEDLNRIREKIYTAAGYSTWLVRFPGGSSNKVSMEYREGAMTALTQLVRDAGYTYYDWNVSSGDAGKTKDPEEIKKNVIEGIRKQQVSVVLMHDSRSYTVDAVEDILIWGLENGYVFLPLTRYSRVVQHHVNN